MAFEPFVQFMRGLQGKVHSSLVGLQGNSNEQIAFMRQLQREIINLDVTSIPFKNLSVVVFDIETTGFYPDKGDQILSIGAVKIRGCEILEEETFYSPVYHDLKLSEDIALLTGLDPQQLKNAPPLSEVLLSFFKFVNHSPLVAHHANHEKNFLQHYCWKVFRAPFKHRIIDTSFLFQIGDPDMKLTRLEDICCYNQIPVINRHHALGDAKLTAQIWKIYTQKIQKSNCHNLKDVYIQIAKL